MRSLFVLLALILAVAQCASFLRVDCEAGPYDVAEEAQHLHCHIDTAANFNIGHISGFAFIELHEPSNAETHYSPQVINCTREFTEATTSASFECEVELPRFAPDGTYTFQVDVASQDFTSTLSNSSHFVVEQEKNDRKPPVLNKVVIPRSINPFFPTSNWIFVDVSDDASGIRQIYVSIHSTMQGNDLVGAATYGIPEEDEDEHDHEHEEHRKRADHDHDHEHEAEPSAPTELQVTLPIKLVHADDLNTGTYYIAVTVWDFFWTRRFEVYEVKALGNSWNVTIINPSNCSAGAYGPTANKPNRCYNCPVSTYSTAGATKCAACPPGTVPTPARDACYQCPFGSFSAAGVVCVNCPSGSKAPLGAYSIQQCEKI